MVPSPLNTYTTSESVVRADHASTENDEIELIFLGTGTSTSIPYVKCLTAPPNHKPCQTCLSTLTPEGKKNIRRNTSAVVRVTSSKDGKQRTLVIDVGKNFLAAAVEWFPKYGLREIDAVLITHAHADAMNGLDDLRGESHFCSMLYCLPRKMGEKPTGWTLGSAIQQHIDVYVSQATFRDIQRAFPYLVAKEFASGGGDVPEFKWHIIEDKVPFETGDSGVRITPFSVHHGRLFTPNVSPTADEEIHPYLCFGFLVQDAIVYMSDVSMIPEDAWEVIGRGGQKSVAVIDCLRLKGHTSHMGVGETGCAVRRIGARRSYMVGFNHDVSHEEYVRIGEGLDKEGENVVVKKGTELLRQGLRGELHWVRPAHDGLRVHVQLRNGRVWDETYT